MDKKVFFTDLDGTLLNDDKQISEKNQQAVDLALAQGHKVVISTGRPLCSAKVLAKRLGLTKEGCYAITFNGGIVYDTYKEEIIFSQTLEEDLAAEIYQAALDAGLHIQSYSEDKVLTLKDNEEVRYYSGKTGMAYELITDLSQAFPVPPCKILSVSFGGAESFASFEKLLEEKYSDKVNYFMSGDYYLEIVPKGIDKGAAVRWLCDYLGISIENSVAAGDAQNDIAMLKATKVAAVMCNATDEIKNYATYVTKKDNNHDGAAEIIETFILD